MSADHSTTVLLRELAAAQSDLARLAQSNAELREALRALLADYEEAMGEWGTGSDIWEKACKLRDAARRALSNEGE